MKLSNEIGNRYGRLLITEEVVRKPKDYKRMVIAVCDCGKIKQYRLHHFICGKIVSCKCFQTEQVINKCKKHLLTKHPIYKLRRDIIVRCENKNSKAYKNYGGRGILICKEWRDSFEIFYKWCIENGWQKGLQIDRINNNGNYEPNNCRFVTAKENCRNRRSDIMLTYKGDRKTMAQWCELFNLEIRTVWARIFNSNWTVSDALETPVNGRKIKLLNKRREEFVTNNNMRRN